MLENEEFILRHKTEERAFTRKRCFTFKSISLFIISSIQSSLQRELDRFFKKLNESDLTEQFVTKSAFSQARKKIDPEAFRELSQKTVNHFYSHYKYHKWKNHRLIAIDGSEVLLPSNKETVKEYGDYANNRTKKNVVIARFSKAYDVLNNIAIDAYLTKRTNGEHKLAEKHLAYLGKGDLLLLDRGYPSYYLFKRILQNESDFCARVTVSNWLIARDFAASGQNDAIIELEPSRTIVKNLYKNGIDTLPLKLRFIKIKLESGEDEVLITSLLDSSYKYDWFKRLYHMRWGVEESFKVDKHQLRMEDFSGYSVQSIMQEFNAMILLSNLAMVFSHVEERETQKKKLKYKVSVTLAISKFRENLVTLFKNIRNLEIMEKLMKVIWNNTIPIRDGRTSERNVYRRRRYHYQYKNL
jgi:hypothetical protein